MNSYVFFFVCQLYFSRKIGVPEFDRNVLIARKVNLAKQENFLGPQIYITNVRMNRLLYDIPDF